MLRAKFGDGLPLALLPVFVALLASSFLLGVKMYLWKVKFTEPQSWRPKKQTMKKRRLSWNWFFPPPMKPIYTAYYITADMGKDTLRRVVEGCGKDPATIKRMKLLGDIRNSADFVSSQHFQEVTQFEYKQRIENGKTIDALKQEVDSLKNSRKAVAAAAYQPLDPKKKKK